MSASELRARAIEKHFPWIAAVASGALAALSRMAPDTLGHIALPASISLVGLLTASVAIVVSASGSPGFVNLRSNGKVYVDRFIGQLREAIIAAAAVTPFAAVAIAGTDMPTAVGIALSTAQALLLGYAIAQSTIIGLALIKVAQVALYENGGKRKPLPKGAGLRSGNGQEPLDESEAARTEAD